jgi:hypothetical protein
LLLTQASMQLFDGKWSQSPSSGVKFQKTSKLKLSTYLFVAKMETWQRQNSRGLSLPNTGARILLGVARWEWSRFPRIFRHATNLRGSTIVVVNIS